ncbi:S24 family peptidase [Methylorubrum suomiense]|uniref:Peptidase S24 n=1 Tax=Methylorubrum suomiense TaxID=144191 RepID=A0ABQ4UZZ9_9HYPH|nr:peptidase S24 [Methylorubrum suomiense]GJE77751.1 hypothetical protein BGCPKDLD_4358 [Methylorubrum suomiense]
MTDEKIRKAQGQRLKAARKAAGYRSAREAALQNEWPESTFRAHEGGTRTIGQDDAERYAARFRFDGVEVTARGILFGDADASEQVISGAGTVGVKGLIAAGGVIETASEQIAEGDSLYEIAVPFPVEEGVIGFRVSGNSGYPKYDEDDVVLCSKHGENPERLVGAYAAVITKTGDRYLKRILQGSKKGAYHLESFNAPLIMDARLRWASGIITTVHARHWRQLTELKSD